ncbi:MAG: hypothetical protein AAGG79_04345 [Pseudomonadota bacterium]
MLDGNRRLYLLAGLAGGLALLLLTAPSGKPADQSSLRFVTLIERMNWSEVMADEEALAAPSEASEEEDVSVISQRPLFDPNRRPPPVRRQAAKPVEEEEPEPDPVTAPSENGTFKLAAVLIRGNEPVAMLRGPKGKLHRVVREDLVEGWMVAAIEPRRIVLRYEDRMDELLLGPSPEGGASVVMSKGGGDR